MSGNQGRCARPMAAGASGQTAGDGAAWKRPKVGSAGMAVVAAAAGGRGARRESVAALGGRRSRRSAACGRGARRLWGEWRGGRRSRGAVTAGGRGARRRRRWSRTLARRRHEGDRLSEGKNRRSETDLFDRSVATDPRTLGAAGPCSVRLGSELFPVSLFFLFLRFFFLFY